MAGLLCIWLLIHGHQEVVQALIAAGANVNQQNNNGWTPLHCAASNGHQAVVQALIVAGADVNQFKIIMAGLLCIMAVF